VSITTFGEKSEERGRKKCKEEAETKYRREGIKEK